MPKGNFVATVWLCQRERFQPPFLHYIQSIESDCRSMGFELNLGLFPYFCGIWSCNNFAITKSDWTFVLPFFVCRQRCNRYWNISSEKLFVSLCATLWLDLGVERWPKFIFSDYGICSNMVANSLPEDTPSTLALSYIKWRLECIAAALLLGNFNRLELTSAYRRRVVVSS